eukprot:6492204-Amphidinium_carterae.1
MATTTVGVATVVNSGKRDAGHLDTLATGMDFEDKFTMSKTTNQQVISPRPDGDPPGREAQRSLTPRKRRAVHRGRHDTDGEVMALDRHAESFSLQIISSFNALQQQLEVLSEEQKQQAQGFTRTIAQRSKLRMTVEGNGELNPRRRVDLLMLELEKSQFELRTVIEKAKYMYRVATESRAHHERFQQRMREEAKRMCAYMSEERTRVYRQTEQRYEGMVTDLRGQLERYKQQFGQKVRETVEHEVRKKSEQIVELQNQMRQGGDNNEVAQLQHLAQAAAHRDWTSPTWKRWLRRPATPSYYAREDDPAQAHQVWAEAILAGPPGPVEIHYPIVPIQEH